jgi:hypothetical protein
LGLSSTDILGTFFDYSGLLILGIFLAPTLLVIGYSILIRIAYRNVSIEKWKKRMAMITNEFRQLPEKEKPGKIGILGMSYLPFKVQLEGYDFADTQNWDRGGLHVIMMRINAIVVVMFAELILELIRYNISGYWIGWVIFPVCGGFLVYYAATMTQRWDIDRRTAEWYCDVKDHIADITRSKKSDEPKCVKRREEREEKMTRKKGKNENSNPGSN